ncbi:MAG: S8 family serine peptidase, partial [Pseudomonadota bacterium]
NGGVAGVDAGATLVSVSVSNDTSVGSCAQVSTTQFVNAPTVASAMDWAMADIARYPGQKAGIVNISMNLLEFKPGYLLNFAMLRLATPALGYPGAFIAHSAGNAGENSCTSNHPGFSYANGQPDPSDGIMVVGAINSNGEPVTRANGGFNSGAIGITPEVNGSNFGNCVEVWAPGKQIRSAWGSTGTAGNQDQTVLSNNYIELDGTSMAAPHIAGVAAYLAESRNLTTPGQIEAAVRGLFYQTMPLKKDASGLPINLVKLVDIPIAPVLVQSIGITPNPNPTYRWNVNPDARSYELTVSTGGISLFTISYPANSICGPVTCSVTPANTLSYGVSYNWSLRATNGAGTGVWSTPATFLVSRPRMQGNITDLMPEED